MLVMEYLRCTRESPGKPLRRRCPNLKNSGRARLLAIFDRTLLLGRLRGCPFHNAAVEVALTMPDIQAMAGGYKRDFIECLTAVAGEAGVLDCRGLGEQLAVSTKGQPR